MMNGLVKVGSYTYSYCGFIIRCCRKNPMTGKTPWSITAGDDHYGNEFSLSDAMATINRLTKEVA